MAHIEVVEDDAPADDYGAVLDEVPIHNAQVTHDSRRKRRVRPVQPQPSRWKRAGLWSLFCLVFWLAYTMRRHLDRPSQDMHAKRWDVKVAILLALMDLLEPISIFFFQLKPTFVKHADDLSNVTRATRFTSLRYRECSKSQPSLAALPQRSPQSQPAYHYPSAHPGIPASISGVQGSHSDSAQEISKTGCLVVEMVVLAHATESFVEVIGASGTLLKASPLPLDPLRRLAE
ncbi:uncharacterized protein SCHCODRAFT_02577572 [Schizophyllum commune H4-8]|uniref:Uncharacterized protein n=1 Tax=Schizophyllum commune (strain H4-8 / FGSC 9210) TaxID=578458 RepID=D8Q663_SCHCM|nr:uncharacterized protein SCHCODRAFT_02577572 [Schizophyllum commune H4-8]KAI5891870.1 hypothetical protein SCHCODRAFT_02577572 [Schizophyllum commune H4-8]